MNSPFLLVIAGCNGSGKSTYSASLAPKLIQPFDYDKCFLSIYNSKPDSELREQMSHNKAFQLLEQAIDKAIDSNSNFCYETNFNSDPMHWPELFRQSDYRLDLNYFCLNSVPEAKKRVQIRFQNGGHFVPNREVEERFHAGYGNLNAYFEEFDNVHLWNTCAYNSPPVHMLSISKGKLTTLTEWPKFMKKLVPAINRIVTEFSKRNS